MEQYKFKDNTVKWIYPEQVKVTKFNLNFKVHLVDTEQFPNIVYKHDNISTENVQMIYNKLFWRKKIYLIQPLPYHQSFCCMWHFRNSCVSLNFLSMPNLKMYAVVKVDNVTNYNYTEVGCVVLICKVSIYILSEELFLILLKGFLFIKKNG